MSYEADSNDELIEIENGRCKSESDCELPPTSSQATAKPEITREEATHATAQEATNLEDIFSKEALTVRQFWKCYNIQNAVDFMVKA
ncbi:hypothetical protein E2C01_057233 [Portunus trituberculatus]|uniref:Uncharacterized protein n=1 Tax=Portunus trituberculatus TaxID=210409 RepID=A0A5B7GZS5_PORTR|nr:hypothetical protein [Portunus trituberculatus]